MSTKLFEYDVSPQSDGTRQLWFHCPGCQCDHAFTIGGPVGARPRWDWNGSMESPTFQPSLMCNRDQPSQCHSFVTDGKIQFLGDCWHDLKGQTVDLPEWDGW